MLHRGQRHYEFHFMLSLVFFNDYIFGIYKIRNCQKYIATRYTLQGVYLEKPASHKPQKPTTWLLQTKQKWKRKKSRSVTIVRDTNTKTSLGIVQSDSKIPHFWKKIKREYFSSNNIFVINHQQLYQQKQHFYKDKYLSSNTNHFHQTPKFLLSNINILQTPTSFIKHQQFPSNTNILTINHQHQHSYH